MDIVEKMFIIMHHPREKPHLSSILMLYFVVLYDVVFI